MIERKLIQMHKGYGQGFFALNNLIQYAGFYELRAYTRWQLNWGVYEHKHLNNISLFFASTQQEKEFYRDYEKLYSRVFPVYDKPEVAGVFNHDMTLRAMRRLYNSDPNKRELKLTLYPEGGNLIEGLPCRIAFEVTWEDGEWAEGNLFYMGDSTKVKNRGRGVFEVTPSKGMDQEVTFVTCNGKTVKAKLPKTEDTGVSLCVEQTDSGWVANMQNTEDLATDSLAISLMHEGRLVAFSEFSPQKRSVEMNDSHLSVPGVYQLTVFDTQGRVFADRLFFSKGKKGLTPNVIVEGLKDEYLPYESVGLKMKVTKGEGSVSVTVRDDSRSDNLYDNGNILTEMLLSSEIRGFVPQPNWYFEADDSLHRIALDLLMMTQGWRRFDWRNMAVRGLWDLTQPAEKAPVLIGNTYKNINMNDLAIDMEDIKRERDSENSSNNSDSFSGEKNSQEGKSIIPLTMNLSRNMSRDLSDYKRAIQRKEKRNKKELKVHAELVMADEDVAYSTFTGESDTWQKSFRIQLPPFYGKSVFFLSVVDTMKWKNDKSYTWIQIAPDNEETDYMYLPASGRLRRKIYVEPADYLARIIWPYPRFVKPYNYYQERLSPAPSQEETSNKEWKKEGEVTLMNELKVKTRRTGLRKFDDSWPVFSIDAYEAENMERDYGLDFMKIMVGDYGVGAPRVKGGNEWEPTFEIRYGYGHTRRTLMDKEIPQDSIYARKYLISGSFILTDASIGPIGIGDFGADAKFELSPGESLEYKGNGVWDKYVFYSDYSPRMEGSKLYYGANEPKTKLVLYPFPDGSRRLTYRDRRYVLDGFAYPADFYSPDYSKHIPSEEQKDYRRTLYWNPNLKLDENGEVHVKFYNNSRTTHLSVEAEGQAKDGTLLWGKTE